ncbi:polycomb protein eed-B-like [Rhopilema esculentum]|uniref:polycomb protein eed-B-like n=1 Tax=Rhopilema esculentum TaxID=499914 RepID=UPI0031D09CCB
MSFETNQSGDTTFKLELDEDTSSMQTESEDLNSPQVNTENEMNESGDESDSSNTISSSQASKKKQKSDGYGKRKRRKRVFGSQQYQKTKASYKCTNYLKEDHKQPIFGVQFYQLLNDDEKDPLVFATVGSNRVSVYKCEEGSGRITLLQNYCDSDPEENYYTSAWSYNTETSDQILAFAGVKGAIHVVSVARRQSTKYYQGHGSSINELRFHPVEPLLLFSASKDHSIRIWNIKTDICVCVLGGVNGHRDEVLSIDLDILGTKLVSCGMDHSLKIWPLETEKYKMRIDDSFKHDPTADSRSFLPLNVHYPAFSTRDVHRNYVDCVRWYGDLILSKSCDNKVILWKPKMPMDKLLQKQGASETGVSVLHKFEFNQCDIWFIKFAMDFNLKLLAVGNQTGKIFLWDLDVNQPANAKCVSLTYPKCTTTIRQICFNKDASVLIATCDDGTVWRWDKQSG